MKRRLLFLIIPLLSLLSVSGFLWLNPAIINFEEPGPRDFLSESEKNLLHEGDLILIKGSGLTSDLIITALNEGVRLSHCGMIVREDNRPMVIHTISPSLSGIDGVQRHSLDDFNKKAMPDSIIVVRPIWRQPESAEGTQAAARARFYLEMRIPFDNVFDFENRDKMYCTELLFQILADGGFWADKARPSLKGSVLPFSAFLDPAEFFVIIRHQPLLGTGK